MIRNSYYHRTLRTCALLVGLVLVFDSGLMTKESPALSDGAVQYLANAVGIVATVPATEVNTLAADLEMRSAELDRREREIDAQARYTALGTNTSTYVLSSILLLLLALIISNYVLDIMRERRRIPTLSV